MSVSGDMESSELDESLSVAEVGRRLGVAGSTVARLIDQEGLPATRSGTRRRVLVRDLDRWLASRRIDGGDLTHLL